jgi:hypothetical protein
MIWIDGNVLFNEFESIVGYNQMVRSDVELDGPISRANRLAVDECVRLLGRNLYFQFSGF